MFKFKIPAWERAYIILGLIAVGLVLLFTWGQLTFFNWGQLQEATTGAKADKRGGALQKLS
ncbi:hypothetical protein ACFL5G_03725 [Candidatus Margulisiibacteriota bacterium]